MRTPWIAWLLVLVVLPIVSWSSLLNFDFVPETGNLRLWIVAALQARFESSPDLFCADAPSNPVPSPAALSRMPSGSPMESAEAIAKFDSGCWSSPPGAEDPRPTGPALDDPADHHPRPDETIGSHVTDLAIPPDSPRPDDGTPTGPDELAAFTTRDVGRALGFRDGGDGVRAGPASEDALMPYASAAYLIRMLEAFRDSGHGSTVGLMPISAMARAQFLRAERATPPIAKVAADKVLAGAPRPCEWSGASATPPMNPRAPAPKWLRFGPPGTAAWGTARGIAPWYASALVVRPEGLAFCLFGLLAMVSLALRRRGAMGGKYDRPPGAIHARRRPHIA